VKAKTVAFIIVSILLAALFIRLGFWQLDRLAERRARNADLSSRFSEPVVAFERLQDTLGYRRATLAGVLDYANEILFTGRSRNGSPGVYILTPVRRTGNDTAVIVLRGWVYAPDAATIDQAAWRESRPTFQGYVHPLQSSGPSAPSAAADRKVRSLSLVGIQRIVPYPIAPLYLVAQDSGSEHTPVRLPAPAFDNGPHLSYAIQWFCFAAIAIGGAAIVAFRGLESRRDGAAGA
jgi:surfeit locus 1 family protein